MKPDEYLAPNFDLQSFLPYLLNQAAEATSQSFQTVYRDAFGMTRTQWRVMANLGKYGAMTAADICKITHIEKTKVSRGVQALQDKEFLIRQPVAADRRTELLSLTKQGMTAFHELGERAAAYDQSLRRLLGSDASDALERVLRTLAKSQIGA